jgi:D-alanine-D-alanine ligase
MRVLVMSGGTSAEREISLATGKAVADALRRLGHEVSTIDPARVGDVARSGVTGPGAGDRDVSLGDGHVYGAAGGPAAGGPDEGHERAGGLKVQGGVWSVPRGILGFLSSPDFSRCDVVFVALHGEVGEDGKVQAVLDLAGVPYTGSGALASALSMNKDLSKKVFLSQGIPTPEWIFYSVSAGSNPGATQRADAVSLPHASLPGGAGRPLGSDRRAPDPSELKSIGGFPVVVKPNDQGSTIGLSVVTDAAQLPKAFEVAARYSDEIIVERYIPGRELTVSILGSEALPVIEIVPEGGLYDYTRKYTKGASRYIVPAEIGCALHTQVNELALKCFHALGCRGFGRVDMRLSPENEVFCLEVNTIPGMTETSLVPMAAKAVDISFDQLVGRILASAAVNGPRQRGKM